VPRLALQENERLMRLLQSETQAQTSICIQYATVTNQSTKGRHFASTSAECIADTHYSLLHVLLHVAAESRVSEARHYRIICSSTAERDHPQAAAATAATTAAARVHCLYGDYQQLQGHAGQ